MHPRKKWQITLAQCDQGPGWRLEAHAPGPRVSTQSRNVHCLRLHQMILLYLVQHLQSLPFSLAQGDTLRLHGPPGHP